MISQNRLHEGGLGQMALRESEDKWQKHVIVALWVFLGLLIAITVALWYASANGLLESLAVHAAPGWPIPSWPVGLP